MLLENLNNWNIILASKSPRRQELLGGLGVSFEVRTKETAEDYPPALQAEEVPRFISRLKAKAFLEELSVDELIITSDTTVHLEGSVLEKPKDLEEAKSMLKMLSGKTHRVITAITIASTTYNSTSHASTDVTFAELSDEEIEFYVDNFKPLDKAGAYGIQELIGFIGVTGINGSYFNVMGLPLHLLYQELKKVPAR